MSLATQTQAHITHFIRKPEILAALGVSAPTLRRLINKGLFPRSVKLGPNSVGWRLDTYEEWAADPEAWAAK